jgi:ribonuclease HI
MTHLLIYHKAKDAHAILPQVKTLKLDHNLAELVLNGKKTSTWRLFDDKDLSVNDIVKLVDKVDPDRPVTWKVIGKAHITTIIQKRLADIGPQDYDGHEEFSSPQNMLKTYQKYYGSDVDLDTPVKIIRFSFNNDIDLVEDEVVDSATKITEVRLYADGGSRGNPGPSALGFAIIDMNDRIVVKKGTYLGITTNNQAEYQALKYGLEEAVKMRVQIVHVYMDSLLVVNQMRGVFKVKNRDLWPIHSAIKDLIPEFKKISFTHVPRQLNKIADAAVNEALDNAVKH